jgi:NAD(P)-dependent dehydrogenase (short-subunit alcohol dehydrogenase family)
MPRLLGSVAVVTGAGGGLGRGTALAFAKEGADVIALDVGRDLPEVPYELASGDEIQETVRQIKALGREAIGINANVRSQAELDDAVAQGLDRFGHIDILSVNHGVNSFGKFWELTEEQWATVIDINLTGVWRSVKAVTPHMIERLRGSIILTSSMNAVEAAPNYAHYCAAKAGVMHLAKVFGLELGRYGIGSH